MEIHTVLRETVTLENISVVMLLINKLACILKNEDVLFMSQ